jgi:glycosyltransferase involved in cell wall biosynthesis
VHRALAERFDRYIATTPAIVDEFAERGLDPAKVRFLPNGVDTDLYAPVDHAQRAALRRLHGLPDGPIVTFVGIIIARKNVDGTLRIWAECVRRGAPGHLVLLGPVPRDANGEEFERQLRVYIAEHGLEGRVTFAGRQARVVQRLQASDIFLFPSRQEGMPNSVLEAMSCALPCVLSSTAGMHDVVQTEKNGMIRELQDEAGLADAVWTLLGNASLREQIGTEARRTVKNRFSLEALAQQYHDMYGELCIAGRRRPLQSD